MNKIDEVIANVSRLGFDTPPIIYFIQKNPTYNSLVQKIFKAIDNHSLFGITSVVTLTEVLTHPIKLKNKKLQRIYADLLLKSANFETVPIDSDIAQEAANLRVRHNLRTPDALQIATALKHNCQAFHKRLPIKTRY